LLFGDPPSLGDKSIIGVTATPSSRISGYSGLNQIPSRTQHVMMVGSTFLSEFGVNLTEWYIIGGLTKAIFYFFQILWISTGIGANRINTGGLFVQPYIFVHLQII